MFYGKRKGFRKVAVTTPRKGKYTPRRKVYNKKPKVSFAQKVNQIIARNVENKHTESKNFTGRVCTLVGSSLEWFMMNNWDTYQFTIPQGVTENQRVGNQIKLKRWIIKGQIHPDSIFMTSLTTLMPNTNCGYIDIYFGRLTNNEEVNNLLPNFLDNGSTSVAPTGAQNQIFKPVNKDAYKIYYHRRFKMSPSITSTTTGGTSGGSLVPNNDFSLVKTFGFDVCKYICKNAILKFDDANTTPQSGIIRQLAMWATWTPAIGDMVITAPPPQTRHYYQLSVCSYAEYEDA